MASANSAYFVLMMDCFVPFIILLIVIVSIKIYFCKRPGYDDEESNEINEKNEI